MSSTTRQLGYVEKPIFQSKENGLCNCTGRSKSSVKEMHTSTALLLQAQLTVLAGFMPHQKHFKVALLIECYNKTHFCKPWCNPIEPYTAVATRTFCLAEALQALVWLYITLSYHITIIVPLLFLVGFCISVVEMQLVATT